LACHATESRIYRARRKNRSAIEIRRRQQARVDQITANIASIGEDAP
jgi:hypothetical protein